MTPLERVLAESPEPAGLIVRRAADIEARPVRWLWHHKLVAGAINMLIGMPDQGKSLLTMDIAARVTVGTDWPVGEQRENERGDAAILSLEDSPETTIVPRLSEAGADLTRVHIVEGVNRIVEDGGGRDGFDIGRDVRHLDQLKQQHPELRLVVIDPLDSYIGRIDSKAGNEVRNTLWPLKDWAERTGVTVLLVHHFNKTASTNAIDRVSGSRSFGALPRSVWVIGKDTEAQDGRTLVLPVKLNLVGNPAGIAFTIQPSMENPEIPYVAWLAEDIHTDVADLLAGEPSAKDEAVAFLRETLANGPLPSKDVEQAAKDAGLVWGTVQRAKRAAGVISRQQKDDGGRATGWIMELTR